MAVSFEKNMFWCAPSQFSSLEIFIILSYKCDVYKMSLLVDPLG